MRTIILLREELRLADNELYDHAASSAKSIIPLFVWDEQSWGAWPPGAASRWWLHHSLEAHARDLQARGSKLLLRRGDTLAAILQLQPQQVLLSRRFEPAARIYDQNLIRALRQAGIIVHCLSTRSLFEPEDLLNGQGQPYKVFTPFAKQAQLLLPTLPAPLPPPARLPAPDSWPASLPLPELELLPKRSWADGWSALHCPGESGANQRLRHFCRQGLAHYQKSRDLPAEDDGISHLSPHLHFGEISPGQVLMQVATLGSAAEPFIRQLLWREFALALLWYFPTTPELEWREDWRDFPWRPADQALLQAWRHGRTGFPLVDAGMRELWHTGRMHNRVRMIAASLLVKNGLQDWRLGAAWFWDTLVDADLANNTLGWQWVAGCGADAAPYFRIFNPILQSRRFDPAGNYIRRWIPELRPLPDSLIHEPSSQALLCAAAGVHLGRDYPLPVLDLARTRLAALAAR